MHNLLLFGTNFWGAEFAFVLFNPIFASLGGGGNDGGGDGDHNEPSVQLRFGNGDTDALPLVLPPVPGGLITKIKDETQKIKDE